ncbi:MAG: hypothetical protein OEW95_08840 [Candidatus Bathyarchaeota archaeon]|nr:hypothetical protein [Candidatus Bathyarchaeota archaeon]
MKRRIVSGIVMILLLTDLSLLTFDIKSEPGTSSSHNNYSLW